MKRLRLLLFLSIMATCFPVLAQTVDDWVGQFEIKRDGDLGTLLIGDSHQPCNGVAWCSLTVSYESSQGLSLPVRILRMEQNNRRMLFSVRFPGNLQMFDAYLFLHDKAAMAGTVRSGSQTFGFFGTKIAKGPSASPARAAAPVSNSGRRAVITSNGTVEIHYADGTVKIPGGCGTVVIFPDGRKSSRSICVQTQPPTPPPLPQDTRWLVSRNAELLVILRALVNDESMVQSYVRSEGNGHDEYQKMGLRIDTINHLLVQ